MSKKTYLDSSGLAYLWTTLKSKFVPQTRKINNKALSADITLSASDVGAIAEPQTKSDGQILQYDAANKVWKASDTAPGGVSSVTEGSTNGTIKVNGTTDIKVHGLNSAAYASSDDFRASSWTPTASEVGAIASSQLGQASGVCPLGSDGKIASTYLPSYVDDVVEAYVVGTALSSGWLSLTSGGSAFTPEKGKIYIIVSDGDYKNLEYRWSGSTYVKINDGGMISMTNDEIDEIIKE